MNHDVAKTISELTLEEKAGLCSGLDFWHNKPVERLGIPSVMITDGPHGLRKSSGDGDFNAITPATCFPTACATASSWDPDLLHEIGKAMAEEALQEDVSVLLGPGLNIKRSPLCGRNFEYFSEDPLLSGEMAAALTNGIQSQGVGACLKHFAVNNQETRRMSISAVVDERALHEIYLPGFERAVRKSKPWMVMCSYNRINGVYASENEWLLTDLLRDQWGFDGVLVTDWGACNDRVEGLRAGQDLEMPTSGGYNDALIVSAVKSGALDQGILDRTVERILNWLKTWESTRKPGFRYDPAAHHALARRAAAESAVLLKNENALLPLKPGQTVALVGAFAQKPRYQGAGSSFINPWKLDTVYDALTARGVQFAYAPGYVVNTDVPDASMIAEAAKIASGADVAIVLAGLPDIYESEAFDRDHMRMPASHIQLIEAVAKANPNTVVVLSNGSPVEMAWEDSAMSILEGYLGGQAGGSGIVDVLYGDVNPSGKLAETFPMTLEDVLASGHFPQGPKTVEYRESIFVGYRYFATAKKPVRRPFGFGLSYTTFAFSGFSLSTGKLREDGTLDVTIQVRNTGSLPGAEVVQVYVRDVESTAFRPDRELKAFRKVFLQPGEQKEVTFSLDRSAFAFYNPLVADWQVESGEFEIMVGSSSMDIHACGKVNVEAAPAAMPDLRQSAPFYYSLDGAQVPDADFRAVYGRDLPNPNYAPGEPFDLTTPLGDLRSNPMGNRLYNMVLTESRKMFNVEENPVFGIMVEKMTDDLPLRNLAMMSGGKVKPGFINGMLMMINGKSVQGVLQLAKSWITRS